MSEEQKIIDLENEIIFLKDVLSEKQNEIEEKSTIIMAGAEKVKQLEKEIQRLEKDNDTLSELVIVNEDKVIKELDLISKDKIKSIINNFRKVKNEILSSENVLGRASITYDIVRNDYCEKMLLELLEEN